MIDDFLEKERYGGLKRRAEDRQESRGFLLRNCHMAQTEEEFYITVI